MRLILFYNRKVILLNWMDSATPAISFKDEELPKYTQTVILMNVANSAKAGQKSEFADLKFV